MRGNKVFFFKRALQRMPNLIIGIVVFAGFAVLNYLSGPESTKIVSPAVQEFFARWKIWGYFLIIVTYVVQQFWRDLPKPVSLKEVEEISPIVEQYLAALLDDYYLYLISNYAEIVPVRVNMMLKVRKHFFQEPKLKIMYSLCCDRVKCEDALPLDEIEAIDDIPVTKACYSVDERDVLWGRGEGSCGQAYKTGQIAFYDTRDEVLKSAANNMTIEQQMVNSKIGSVVSMPIWLHGTIIGVLNIDSPKGIEDTKFKEPEVHRILKEYAGSIAIPCAIFADGVNPDAIA